jgi:protein TonB
VARPRPARVSAPPQPVEMVPPVAPAEVQAGSRAGTSDGAQAGVSGGVSGGQVGGVVGGRGSGPVPAGQVAHPPTLLARIAPQYPRPARLAGVEGLVVLEAVVDAHGRVGGDIKVLRSVSGLDDAATEALRRARFTPARDERGQTLPVILEVPIRFVLR